MTAALFFYEGCVTSVNYKCQRVVALDINHRCRRRHNTHHVRCSLRTSCVPKHSTARFLEVRHCVFGEHEIFDARVHEQKNKHTPTSYAFSPYALQQQHSVRKRVPIKRSCQGKTNLISTHVVYVCCKELVLPRNASAECPPPCVNQRRFS